MNLPNGKRVAAGVLAVAWLGVTSICLSVEPSRADTVFDLTGTFADSSTVSGSLTINLTTGTIDAANLSYGGATYSTILGQGPFTGNTTSGQTPVPVDYFVDIGSSASLLPRIDLGIPGTSAVDSLISYTGGNVCVLVGTARTCGPDQRDDTWYSDFQAADGMTIIALSTGELTATPLRAALPLLATGLSALGLLGWRRKRKAPAIAAA